MRFSFYFIKERAETVRKFRFRNVTGNDRRFRRHENHEETVSIGGRPITNLRFAYDIVWLSKRGRELAKLVERLDNASTAYGIEISAKKTELMTNYTSGINTEIKVNEQKLETVTSLKYLGSVITDEGSRNEILSRIAQTTAALILLRPVDLQEYFCQFQDMTGAHQSLVSTKPPQPTAWRSVLRRPS